MKFFVAMLASLLIGCAATNGSERPKDPIQAVTFKSQALKLYRAQAGPGAIVFPLGVFNEAAADLLVAVLAKADEENRPVLIVIDSPGGSLSAAYRIMRAIDISGSPIVCLGDGMVASSAFFTFIQCPVRLATPKTIFLAHGPSVTMRFEGGAKEMRNELEELKVVTSSLCVHVSAHTKITKAECMERAAEKDWYFDTDDAKTYGVLDRIVKPQHLPPPTPVTASE